MGNAERHCARQLAPLQEEMGAYPTSFAEQYAPVQHEQLQEVPAGCTGPVTPVELEEPAPPGLGNVQLCVLQL